MPEFDTAEVDRSWWPKLMVGSVLPRPIAFVSTAGKNGVSNIAPFSFFAGVCYQPPTILFSVQDRQGELKDTSRNIEEHPEFIVHIVNEELAEQMNVTSGDYGAHISEFVEAGLTAVPGTRVKVPRVADAPIAMECKWLKTVRMGYPGSQTSVIFGEVIHWHIADAIFGKNGHIDPEGLRAVGRMGGMTYCRTRERFDMNRPVIREEDPRSVAAWRRAQAGGSPK
jgi:flavin reductase (DIM6/NTAB) family NADH-FMN oxidoreductase RutF